MSGAVVTVDSRWRMPSNTPRAQRVGLLEGPFEATHVYAAGEGRHLMHDDLRLGGAYRRKNPVTVETVGDHRPGSQVEQRSLLAGCAGERDHLVAAGEQLRQKPLAHDPGRARYEDPHQPFGS